MEDCIFCKIVNGELPSMKIYEDSNFLVFLDIMPIVRGHTLIIPKTHIRNVFDTPKDIARGFYPVIVKISNAIKKAYDADGVNILQFNEPEAGQEVFHSHVHIVPRYSNDGICIGNLDRLHVTSEDLASDARKIILSI